ncbi:hypothetical protein ACHAXA_010080 [Cyclostephanos tholiformis]|uniref:Uncharacterized protein n=1 Tax=Cyclostephanos tholiformis TaxID=382380 RepID=A0ABD3R6Y0_9STRA
MDGIDVPSPRPPLPLVDLRSRDEFDEMHLSHPSASAAIHHRLDDECGGGVVAAAEEYHDDGSDGTIKRLEPPIIVNLPLSSLISGERSCELPPRHMEFAVLIPRGYARSFLLDNVDARVGECAIRRLFFSSRSESTKQSRKPWLVRQVLIDDDNLWKEASDMGCIRRGSGGDDGIDDGIPFRRLPRLWKPDPLISSDILPLLKEWTTKMCDPYSGEEMCDERSINCHVTNAEISSDETSVANTLGLVWDLGCGAGRDICYLAEEMKEFQHTLLSRQREQSTGSFHFFGIDNHKGSERRCKPLWKNRGVDDIADSVALDLNKLHLVRDQLMTPPPTKVLMRPGPIPYRVCIIAIRYLNRKLLSYIAEATSATNIATTTFTRISKNTMQCTPPPLELPLGTLVAISHFCKPEEGASWNFDHPKESNVLERHELRRLFRCDAREDQKWHILKDDLIIDGDHGRTLIQFVARMIA